MAIHYDGHEDEFIIYRRNGQVISTVRIGDIKEMPLSIISNMARQQRDPKPGIPLLIPLPHKGRDKYWQTQPVQMYKKEGQKVNCITGGRDRKGHYQRGSDYEIESNMKLDEILKDFLNIL